MAAYAKQINGHAIVDNDHYRAFQDIIEQENPDAIFTDWLIDNHPDHRAIANLTYESWKQLQHRFALYYYEVSDGEDTTQFPAPTHYVDITETADQKRAACYAHASQSPDFYYGLQDTVATFRGLQSGSKKAEAYIMQVGSPFDIFPRTGLGRSGRSSHGVVISIRASERWGSASATVTVTAPAGIPTPSLMQNCFGSVRVGQMSLLIHHLYQHGNASSTITSDLLSAR